MAHNIATIDGGAAMAYLDSTPWHGLGERLQLAGLVRTAMIDAALDAARLRYKVASVPLYLADGTEVTGHKASVRLADNGDVAALLSVVGDGYAHIQNDRAVDILRVLVESFGYVPAAAGALGDGERCWMLLRAADAAITPVDGDSVNGYFLLHWGHDGNISLQGLGTTIRVVCQNTLGMATKGKRSWIVIRHTASADARIDEAARLVKAIAETLQLTGDTFATMARRNMTAAEVRAYVAKVIPNTTADAVKLSPKIEARRETILQLVHAGKGAEMANQLVDTTGGAASLWAVYNATAEYFDHVRPAEATNASGLQRAYESAVFGGNAEIKAAALVEARQLLTAN